MAATIPYTLEHLFGVGQPVRLEFQHGDDLVRCPSRIEDHRQDRLWVGMPMQAGMIVIAAAGTTVLVSIVREDAPYVVPTRSIGHRQTPVPLLELAPTGRVERRQQREYVRLPLTLTPSAMLLAGDGAEAPLAVTAVNISAGGLLLRTQQAVQVGQRIRLTAALPEPAGALNGVVEVIRVIRRQTERGRFNEVGCRFLDLNARDRDRITRFILQYQVKQARPR